MNEKERELASNDLRPTYQIWRGRKGKSFKRNFLFWHPRCYKCGRKSEHPHHLTYAHIRNEQPGELMALCHVCHEIEHGCKKHGEVLPSIHAGLGDGGLRPLWALI